MSLRPDTRMPSMIALRGSFSKLVASHLSGLLVLSSLFLSVPTFAMPGEEDAAAIEHLIRHVGISDVTFVRNSSQHTPKRAMRHIRDKYEHYFSEIDSPENFIDLCASESLLTGRDYFIIDSENNSIKSRDWLLKALKQYRSTQ